MQLHSYAPRRPALGSRRGASRAKEGNECSPFRPALGKAHSAEGSAMRLDLTPARRRPLLAVAGPWVLFGNLRGLSARHGCFGS